MLHSNRYKLNISLVLPFSLILFFTHFLLLSPHPPVLLFPSPCQRAMRVRSHSMETMVGSHRHRSPGLGGGVPASVSGGGLPQSTSECTKSTFTVSKGAYWEIGKESGNMCLFFINLNLSGGNQGGKCVDNFKCYNTNEIRKKENCTS